MNDSSETVLPIAGETQAELEAQDAQDDDAPVPLRKDAARTGSLSVEHGEGADEAES